MDKSLVRISTPTHRSESGFLSQGSESSHKIFSIRLVINNRPLFDPSNHHMVQSPWTIESCLSRHTLLPKIASPLSELVRLLNSVPIGVPLITDACCSPLTPPTHAAVIFFSVSIATNTTKPIMTEINRSEGINGVVAKNTWNGSR